MRKYGDSLRERVEERDEMAVEVLTILKELGDILDVKCLG